MMESTAIKLRVLSDKLQRNCEDYGWAVALKKVVAHLFSQIYLHQVYRIFRIGLGRVERRRDFGQHDLTFRLLTTRDVDAIGQVERVGEWFRGELNDRIAKGQLCMVVVDGEKVVGFNLVSFGRIVMPLVGLEKRLGRGSAWSEHIAVRKGCRQMGLASQLRYRVFDELRNRGVRRLYGGTLRSNLAGTRMQESVGFRAIVDIHYRKILGWRSWQYKRVRE
jgi:GNAT superfamily N-acetyltransferase